MSEKYTAKDIARFLQAANHDLALGKYKAKDMIPDYCKAVLIGFQLQAQLDKAINVLRNLHDEQNGPPLFRREKQWQAAMDKAEEVLKESENEVGL